MWYAYDADGWYTGEAEPEAPNATPISPPAEVLANTTAETGVPRARWVRYVWEVQTLDTAEVRAAMWVAIKAERDSRTQQGGYQTGGHWFHSDNFSRTQQLGLVLLGANIPPGLQWKTMSGAFVLMTQQLAGQVFAAAAASDTAMFAFAEGLRAQVDQAANPLAVDITTGWPAIYGE